MPGQRSASGPRRDVTNSNNARQASSRRVEKNGLSDQLSDVGVVSDSFLRPTFTIDQIRTFLAVAAREHVTHAAQVLRLSQPAVTQQVQLLERALGIRLLERIGRNVRLTTAGIEVAGVCLLVMRALESLDKVVQALRGLERGSVTIGASELAASYYLPAAITEFATAHPGVNIGVIVADSDEVCHEVAAGHLECGLVDGACDSHPSLVRTEVATTDILVVFHPSHPLAGRTDCPEALLTGSRYLIWGPGSATEALAAPSFGEHYDRVPQLFIGSMEAARRSVLSAPTFVTSMPSIAVASDIESGSLVSLRAACLPLPVVAVRRSGPDSPAVDALWQTLLRRTRDI
jgi:DNA-binding transcriptional LysR family regulator